MSNLIKKAAKSTLQYVLITALKHGSTRRLINGAYNKLSYKRKAKVHKIFAKTFRNRSVKLKDSLWTVTFNNTTIYLPLMEKDMWLDWDEALSILGHDISIKQTYQNLIETKQVRCFFDIGANYGTHSLLFLSQGINTTTFEPNPHCTRGFKKLLAANDLTANIVSKAVGDHNHKAELSFPERDTWLGTLSKDISTTLEREHKLNVYEVEVITIDTYLKSKFGVRPDLIKIDTEGYELNVLRGAFNSIIKHRPLIIFEENEGGKTRQEIYEFFENARYTVYTLPYTATKQTPIHYKEFLTSSETNFIAVHNLKVAI